MYIQLKMELTQRWILIGWISILLSRSISLSSLKWSFPDCYDNKTGVLLFVILTVWCVPLTLARSTCNKGVITPRNPYFLLGQDINITCTRTIRKKNMQLIFKRGRHETEVESKYIRLNDTSVQLLIENVTATDIEMHKKRMNYLCYDRRRNGDVCLDNIFVKLDYYPVKPMNVTCRVYNWDTMTCQWLLGVTYVHENDVNITCQYEYDTIKSELDYRISHYAVSWANCPQQNRTACFWDSDHFPDSEYTVVRVNVTNTHVGVSASTEDIEFQRYNIIEPAPVNKSAINVTQLQRSDCVTIQWRPDKEFRDHYCEVRINSSCSPSESRYSVYKYSHRPAVVNRPAVVEFCGLTPNTVYTCVLRCRALDYDSQPTGFWSRSTLFQHTSPPAAPKLNPVARDGLFDVDVVDSNSTDHQVRIHLYIQPLNVCDTHSDTVQYNITTPNTSVAISHPSHDVELALPAGAASQIQLYATSDYGRANNYSIVEIHPRNQWPTVSVELVVEEGPSGICTGRVITHHREPTFSHVTHTLVWCRQVLVQGRASCQDPLQWQELEENSTHYTYSIAPCTPDYRFGVVTKGRNVRSGEIISTAIQWTECLYKKGAVPTKPLKGIHQTNLMALQSFHVQWEPYECSGSRKAYMTGYSIAYCTRTDDHHCACSGEMARVNITSQGTNYSVNHMEPGSRVCFWIRAVTAAGLGPNNTKPLDVFVKADEYFPIVWFLIGPVSVVVIISFVVWLFRRFNIPSKFRDVFKKADINVPTLLLQPQQNDPAYDDADYLTGATLKPEFESSLNSVKDSGTSSLENASHGSETSRDTVVSERLLNQRDSAVDLDLDFKYSYKIAEKIDPYIPVATEEMSTGLNSYVEVADVIDFDSRDSRKIEPHVHMEESTNLPEVDSYVKIVDGNDSDPKDQTRGDKECFHSDTLHTSKVHSESTLTSIVNGSKYTTETLITPERTTESETNESYHSNESPGLSQHVPEYLALTGNKALHETQVPNDLSLPIHQEFIPEDLIPENTLDGYSNKLDVFFDDLLEAESSDEHGSLVDVHESVANEELSYS